MTPSAGAKTEQVPVSAVPNGTIHIKAPMTNGVAIGNPSPGVKLLPETPSARHTAEVKASCDTKVPHLSIAEEYKVTEAPLGSVRPVRVLCIGAGASGVNLAYQVQKHMQQTDLVIYEKNPQVGGTWYENRYPGCKCDIRKYFFLCVSQVHLYLLNVQPHTTTNSLGSRILTGQRSSRLVMRSENI